MATPRSTSSAAGRRRAAGSSAPRTARSAPSPGAPRGRLPPRASARQGARGTGAARSRAPRLRRAGRLSRLRPLPGLARRHPGALAGRRAAPAGRAARLSRAGRPALRRRAARRAARAPAAGRGHGRRHHPLPELRARLRGRHLRPVRRYARRPRPSSAPYMKGHGGVLGESLWAGLHPVIGAIGIDGARRRDAMVAGLLLVSGSSLGLWASRSRRGRRRRRRARRAARRSARPSRWAHAAHGGPRVSRALARRAAAAPRVRRSPARAASS